MPTDLAREVFELSLSHANYAVETSCRIKAVRELRCGSKVAFHELGLCVHRDMGRALIVCDGTFCIGLPLPADENEALDSPAINPGFIQRVVQEALALVTIGVGGLVMMSLEPAAKPVGQLFSRATDRRLVTHIITSIDAENRQVLEAQVREVVLQYLQLAKALVHGPGVLPGP